MQGYSVTPDCGLHQDIAEGPTKAQSDLHTPETDSRHEQENAPPHPGTSLDHMNIAAVGLVNSGSALDWSV